MSEILPRYTQRNLQVIGIVVCRCQSLQHREQLYFRKYSPSATTYQCGSFGDEMNFHTPKHYSQQAQPHAGCYSTMMYP